MLQLLLLLLASSLAVLTALIYLALRYLPGWGVMLALLGGTAALALGAKFFAKRLLTAVFLIPFKAKGACLRGAHVAVHSIEPCGAPPRARVAEDAARKEGPGVPRDYYRLDLTISPRGVGTPFQFWEPSELLLMPHDARIRLEEDPTVGRGPEILDYELVRDGAAAPDEVGKHHGPQRLWLTIAVPEGGPRLLKFRYYFEEFGDIRLPAVAERA